MGSPGKGCVHSLLFDAIPPNSNATRIQEAGSRTSSAGQSCGACERRSEKRAMSEVNTAAATAVTNETPNTPSSGAKPANGLRGACE